jgi:hypothetical protein
LIGDDDPFPFGVNARVPREIARNAWLEEESVIHPEKVYRISGDDPIANGAGRKKPCDSKFEQRVTTPTPSGKAASP